MNKMNDHLTRTFHSLVDHGIPKEELQKVYCRYCENNPKSSRDDTAAALLEYANDWKNPAIEIARAAESKIIQYRRQWSVDYDLAIGTDPEKTIRADLKAHSRAHRDEAVPSEQFRPLLRAVMGDRLTDEYFVWLSEESES